MVVMWSCRKHSSRSAELLGVPRPFITLLTAGAGHVELVDILWIGNMELIWIDTNDRAVFGVQIADVECVLTTQHHIVVEFVPV